MDSFDVWAETDDPPSTTADQGGASDGGDKSGVSEAELEQCAQVLTRLNKVKDVATNARYRSLRKSVHSFYHGKLARAAFGGTTAEAFKERSAKVREEMRKRERQKHLDAKVLARSQLRADRQAALERLQRANGGSDVPMIADGPAQTNNFTAIESPSVTVIAQIEESNDSQENKAGATGVTVAGSDDANLHRSRPCYTCKSHFTQPHHFYADLCPLCADLNWDRRNQTVDMTGAVALVTGCRVKIGYQICLKLLRTGASVIGTTRFPHDAAKRFAAEKDFKSWEGRLHLYSLDLRDIARLDGFVRWILNKYPRLDALVNNACQTVRRPAFYYQHLIQAEVTPSSEAPQLMEANTAFSHSYTAQHGQKTALRDKDERPQGDGGFAVVDSHGDDSCHENVETGQQMRTGAANVDEIAAVGNVGVGVSSGFVASAALLSQVSLLPEDTNVDPKAFPEGARDVSGQQLDLRTTNSWILKLGDVSIPEAAEVLAINTLAPFALCSGLKPLLISAAANPLPSSTDARVYAHVINVSAMEGKFYRHKTANHPHTNMAKAALNMMTRTSAEDWAKQGVLMNAVDTGWINDENPLHKAADIAQRTGFQTPIDEVDAAARCVDPLFSDRLRGDHRFGKFYKDYHETSW